MATRKAASARECAVLEFIYQQKYATADDVRCHVLPALGLRSVQLALQRLQRAGFVAGVPLYPEQGARSPRAYHLLQAGARAIGLPSLGNHHYRPPTRLTYLARKARVELELLSRQHGGTMVREDASARAALYDALAAHAWRKRAEQFAPHVYAHFVPTAVQPDVVLCLPAVTAICVVAPPTGGAAFWRERLGKYGDLLTHRAVPLLAVALSAIQQAEAWRVVERAGQAERVVVTMVDGLDGALERLCQAALGGPGAE